MDSARAACAACAGSGLKRSKISSRIFRGDTRTGGSSPDFRARKATRRFAFAAK